MALVGTFSFNFQVILPLLARFAFHGSATTYAALTSAMAVGSVVGALMAGARGRVSPGLLALAGLGFGFFTLAAAAAPSLALEVGVLVATGAASVTFAAGINSTLQLSAPPAVRGRVMALYSVVFLGSTPIGAPIAGWLSGIAGPRSSLVLAGVAAMVGGVGLWRGLQMQHAADSLNSAQELLHVGKRVMNGKRRPRGRRHPEPAHQRLRAVMPRSNANTIASEDLADVVRMRPLEREGDERSAIARRERAVDHESRHL
jgi:MFS family permease